MVSTSALFVPPDALAFLSVTFWTKERLFSYSKICPCNRNARRCRESCWRFFVAAKDSSRSAPCLFSRRISFSLSTILMILSACQRSPANWRARLTSFVRLLLLLGIDHQLIRSLLAALLGQYLARSQRLPVHPLHSDQEGQNGRDSAKKNMASVESARYQRTSVPIRSSPRPDPCAPILVSLSNT